MKSLNSIYLIFILALLVSCTSTQTVISETQEKTTFEKLAGIKNVVSVEKKALVSHFDENYELWFEQPIDHSNPARGTFRQLVYLGFENPSKPVIVELKGYGYRE